MSLALMQKFKDLVEVVSGLNRRVEEVEKRGNVSRQEFDEWKALLLEIEQKLTKLGQKEHRGLCPKCGVKPNHFFHVKHCKGNAQVAAAR